MTAWTKLWKSLSSSKADVPQSYKYSPETNRNMATLSFALFVFALVVAVSNVLLAIIVYYTLYLEKKLTKGTKVLKELSLYYAIGMIFAVVASLYLFVMTF